jgi:hypothetical protein
MQGVEVSPFIFSLLMADDPELIAQMEKRKPRKAFGKQSDFGYRVHW